MTLLYSKFIKPSLIYLNFNKTLRTTINKLKLKKIINILMCETNSMPNRTENKFSDAFQLKKNHVKNSLK